MDPFTSATALLQRMRAGTITSAELVDCLLDRIARYNPHLNAIVTLDGEKARQAAHEADQRRQRGVDAPLLGLPVTIKDAIDVAGWPTTAGVVRRGEARAEADAPVVARLRAAGAVLLGKTNVPPYVGDWQTDNRLFGRTVNPWNPARTPGGSTGGGAAAVAAGLSPLEFGSDIGGSIRIPAAFCGIYGHRPSETLLPRSGHIPGWPLPNAAAALNVIGPLTRSAEDLELALGVTAGAEPGEDVAWRLALPAPRHEELGAYRVAVLPLPAWLPIDDDIRAAQDEVVGRLRNLGLQVEEAEPEMLDDLRTHHRLFHRLLGANFGAMRASPPERREADAAEMRATGDEFDAAQAEGLMASAAGYLAWHAERERFRAAYRDFFRTWDILLTPAAPVPAFPHDDRPYFERTLTVNQETIPYRRLTVFPALATLSGQPATIFPAGQTPDGLPVGLQAIGPYLEDRTPIRFAGLLAKEIGGYRPPPGFE